MDDDDQQVSTKTGEPVLKACPFCGSDGEMLRIKETRNASDIAPFPWLCIVECTYCQVRRFALGVTPKAAREQAVADWQTRTAPKGKTKGTALELCDGLVSQLLADGYAGVVIGVRLPDGGTMTVQNGDLSGLSTSLREAVTASREERCEHGIERRRGCAQCYPHIHGAGRKS